MSLLKNNIFWEIQDKPETKQPVAKKTTTSPLPTKDAIHYQDSAASNGLTLPDDFNSINPQVSPSDLDTFRKHFADVLAKANQPGNDYIELIAAKNAMSSIPVESQRYQVAFAGLSAAGLTKDVVIKTANYYLSVIDNEINGFNQSFPTVYKQEVDDKKTVVEQKHQQMLALSKQIEQLNKDIQTLSAQVADSSNSLNSKKNSYAQAAQEAKDTINSEIEKINSYIQ